MKQVLKVIGIILLIVLIVALCYVGYVFGTYSRIEDKLELEPQEIGSVEEQVKAGETYSIMTYNLGFGAYTQDYSFFMDGGKYSWAKSKDGLIENMNGAGKYINDYDTDFAIMQEVDTDGTRTYHVNELDILKAQMGEGDYIFAMNFHSAFLMYPLTQPHGANESGIITYSKYKVDSSLRRSLPISTSVKKIVDLDRCYSITKIKVDNGKYLCIYNVHLSAYGTDDTVRAGQLEMLFGDISNDYAAGNYVIVGGDFNHNLRGEQIADAPGWAQPFPIDQLPEGFKMAFNVCESPDLETDTCRDSDIPYIENGVKTDVLTVMVDGFIVSDNIDVVTYKNIDAQFYFTDHNPVKMEFILK